MTYPFDKPLENESGKAFKAFCIYRDLGDGRTLDEAYRLAKGQPDSRKTANGGWTNWQSKYHWVERAKAYDAYLLEKVRQKREKQHIAELEEYRQKLSQSSKLALSVSVEMLNLVRERIKRMTPDEREKLSIKLLSSFSRAGNDGIEKAMDGWGMALGVDDLMDRLESEDSE